MKRFAELIDLSEEISTPKVHYYTIKVSDKEFSEFELFTLEFKEMEEVSDEYNDLLAWIRLRLGKWGALDKYFRHERSAQALPPGAKYLEMEYEHNLRLYTVRLSDNIVILLNGGIKTRDLAQNCPNVSRHFRFANRIADEIDKSFTQGALRIAGRNLIYNSRYVIYL